MSFPNLTTNRLLLRGFSTIDTSAYVQLLQDPQAFPFISDNGPPTVSDVERKIARNQKSFQMGRDIYWVVALKESNVFIGYLAAHNFKETCVSLSYAMSGQYRRRGFMKEAISAVTGYLLTLGAEVLEARVHAGNHASAALLASLGFTRVAFRDERDIFRQTLVSRVA